MSYKSLHFRCYAVLVNCFVIVDPCDGFLGVIPHILEFLDKYFWLPVGLSLKATRRRSVKGILPLFCHIGGFHVTSSPPCWWTVNKRSLISSLCLSTSICSFHHCYLCLPRLHENHLLWVFSHDITAAIFRVVIKSRGPGIFPSY